MWKGRKLASPSVDQNGIIIDYLSHQSQPLSSEQKILSQLINREGSESAAFKDSHC